MEKEKKAEKEKPKFTYKIALLILVAIAGWAFQLAPYIKAEMEYRDMVARYNSGQMKR